MPMGKVKEYNRHHICARERGGTWASENIVVIDKNVHNAIHRVFKNDLPHEQHLRLLSINGTAHEVRFIKIVTEAILDNIEYAYKDGILVHK